MNGDRSARSIGELLPMQDNRKRPILLVSNKVYHYRVPVYEHLSDRLADIGFDLFVLTNEIEAHAKAPKRFQLDVEPFRFKTYWNAIKRLDPPIVIFFLHARDIIVWPLVLMLKLRGRKVIYWNHGINLQTPDSRLKRAIFGIFHHYADAIILYSANEKKYVAGRYWNKIFIANNTLNFHTLPDIPDTKEALRRQMGVRFEKVVLFVGRITPEKRLEDLIAAARYLEPGIGIVVVGDGLTDELKTQVGESPNIQYLGGMYDADSVNRVFKMADVFSIPGKVGLGVNQAFFWGLPIVTENVRHSPEFVYVRDGINGFVVERGDVRMLADKINFLLSSADRYKRFSDAARSEILENASIDRMCDGFVQAIGCVQEQSVHTTDCDPA